MPLDFANKRVLVVGLGLQGGGVGVVRYLVLRGAQVTVTDLKGPEELRPSLLALSNLSVEYVLGTHEVANLTSYDLIVRNPAVRRDAPILKRAMDLGIPVTMEMNLFFRECPSRIVGITGSKGKSTTASLVAHLLRQANRRVTLAGNLGISALEQLPECDDETTVVLELSSWQLEGLGENAVSPEVAVVTRIFPDHMDTYPDFESYLEAKLQITRYQDRDDLLVVSRDDAYWARFAGETPGRVVTYSSWSSTAEVWTEAGYLWVRSAEGSPQKLVPTDQWSLKGQHNLSNLAGAVATAYCLGVEPEELEQGIATFRELPHRLCTVGKINGVTYVDDSAATVPEAAAAAVSAFDTRRVILICGGADKALDPSPLASIAANCKAIALLGGSGTAKLRVTIEARGPSCPIGEFGTLEDALEWCSSMAIPGDVVLLSPGYASFGMFTNYQERGRRFAEWVQSRAGDHVR